MKIKGWEKISGYTYKGYTIVNPIHNADETMYGATILNLNLPQKPKWHLELMIGNGYSKTTLNLLDLNGINIEHKIELVDIRTVSLFRVRYEEIIDEMLARQLLSAPAPISHSIVNNSSYGKTINPNNYGKVKLTGTGGGILTTINSNANNVVWDPNTNLPSSMLIAIKELQRQIDELKQNTPTNPF
jgi:hypothetical protein